MTELQELIRAAQEKGDSLEDMAKRARMHDFSLTKQYLQKVVSGAIDRPGRVKLAAIAKAIDKDEITVVEAAARSQGVHVEHNLDFRTGQLLGELRQMPQATRDLWFQLARALARELRTGVVTEGGNIVIAVEGQKELSPHSERVIGSVLDDAEQKAAQQIEERKATER